MGEQILKFIVTEINKLLNSDYNMISLDSLSKNALLQIFIDCLHKMDVFPKMNVERATDEALTKLVRFLSDIKVPLPAGANENDLANGVIQGKRNILHSALNWILSNQDEVKRRAYLSKFLVKVEFNPAILSEPDMEPLLQQYDELINEFKKVYTQTTRFSKMAKATVELRNEIDKQSKDLPNILELIEKQKTKMENIPNKESLLVSVRALRSELSAENMLMDQIKNQTAIFSQLEANYKSTYDNLKEQRSFRQAAGGPLNKIEEEIQASHMIVQERLPHELENLRTQIYILENIDIESEPTEMQISSLQEKVDLATQDIQIFIEKNMLYNDPRDEKLSQFRQHATVIANNKQLATEQYMELREEFGLVCRQIEEKEAELREIIGGTLPQGADLKHFVSQLRNQSVIYKEKRAQLLELQTEVGVLARTQDILYQQDPTLAAALQNRDENDLAVDDNIPQDISELKETYKELNAKNSTVKSNITHLRKEIQTASENMEELIKTHQKQQEEYDTALTVYKQSVTKLQQQVTKLEENVSKEEKKWKEVRQSIDEKEILLENLYRESKDGANDGKQTYVELLNQKIKEKEMKKQLLDENIRRSEREKEENEAQVHLWNSTLRILQCKRENRY